MTIDKSGNEFQAHEKLMKYFVIPPANSNLSIAQDDMLPENLQQHKQDMNIAYYSKPANNQPQPCFPAPIDANNTNSVLCDYLNTGNSRYAEVTWLNGEIIVMDTITCIFMLCCAI